MAKDYFQDLSDTERLEPERSSIPMTPETEPVQEQPQRSIRNIAPSPTRPHTSRFGALSGSAGGPPRPPRRIPGVGTAPSGKKRSIVLWVLGFIALIGFGFALASMFRKTTITVIPREHTVVFDEQVAYVAYPEGSSATSSSTLAYITDARSFDDATPVTASGVEQVSDAASGTIMVYNAYSDDSVRLIKNTRFETSDGKVFRIRDSIVVPGKTSKGPGSITATVYADQPGTAYNIGPVDKFTLPGLKDTPDMYTGVYGRSTTAMTGGFSGTRPAVSKTVRDAAVASLTTSLKAKIASAYADTKDVYALVPLATISYGPLAIETNSDGTLSGKLTANVVVPQIDRVTLDTFLAKETNADTGGATIRIKDPISFSITPTNTGKVLALGTDSLEFSISGNAVFVWQVDSERLAKDLAGKNKAAFEAIVGGYPSIDSANAKVYPLWSHTFPTDPSGIKVVLEEGTER